MLALTTSFEVGQLGIETVIVMPGAFVLGTQHFADASDAGDDKVTEAYAELDGLVARNEEAIASLFDPDEGRAPTCRRGGDPPRAGAPVRRAAAADRR